MLLANRSKMDTIKAMSKRFIVLSCLAISASNAIYDTSRSISILPYQFQFSLDCRHSRYEIVVLVNLVLELLEAIFD